MVKGSMAAEMLSVSPRDATSREAVIREAEQRTLMLQSRRVTRRTSSPLLIMVRRLIRNASRRGPAASSQLQYLLRYVSTYVLI